MLATIALFAASTVSAHAQTNWTGLVSSNWFVGANWDTFLFPRQTDDATINTVTPNSTVLSDPGALARNLTVGANGTGMLTIQNGGTLADSSGAVGNLPGGLGTVTVTGAGSNWSNAGTVVVGGLGTGTLNIQNGGTVNSGGGSVGLSPGSTGTVTVTGPGSGWINGVSGGLNIGSFGTGTLMIANGGTVFNFTNFTANIGQGAGSQGTVTVTGAGSSWINNLGVNIGNLGTGTLTIADGGVVAGPVTIATNAGSIGTLNIGAGAGNPAAAPGTTHGVERRIWRRHRYDQLQSHVHQLRVCAGDQRQRHCQCARRHHHAHSCQHLQRSDERQRGHVARRRAEHVQPEFASDGSRAAERSISMASTRPYPASPMPAW